MADCIVGSRTTERLQQVDDGEALASAGDLCLIAFTANSSETEPCRR
jgi:hypothetical protein